MGDHVYPLELLYDGDCPICQFEIAKLRKADRHSHLIFTDITEPDFNPERYGVSLEELHARMHARCKSREMVEGVEVMRLALSAVGMPWLVAPTRWPLFKAMTEASYSWFAQHRIEIAHRFGGLFKRITPGCKQTCRCGKG
jgi:predicted DCC family thiol-disulfide oxidoreductase YuxK